LASQSNKLNTCSSCTSTKNSMENYKNAINLEI